MLTLRHITKSFPLGPLKIEVLQGVDFDLAAGDLVAIQGASGSGKSTLLNLIGLLDSPTTGSYLYGDTDVLRATDDERAQLRNRHFGFVFQQFLLLPHLTAVDNVALPLLYRNTPPAEMRARAQLMLERVGLAARAQHLPGQLSGGEQQRIAIARALIGSPQLILADEPTGSPDAVTSQEIMALFLSLNRDEKITIILTTHNGDVARQCSRRVSVEQGQILPS